jgi:predicted XRE-type DNA-binding protein
MTKNRPMVEEGSGNVFADLDFPNPEQEQLKARLTCKSAKQSKERGLTQAQAGTILGIGQPHVSSLMRVRSGSLMEFLTDLGQDVEIIVRPTHKPHAQITVTLG